MFNKMLLGLLAVFLVGCGSGITNPPDEEAFEINRAWYTEQIATFPLTKPAFKQAVLYSQWNEHPTSVQIILGEHEIHNGYIDVEVFLPNRHGGYLYSKDAPVMGFQKETWDLRYTGTWQAYGRNSGTVRYTLPAHTELGDVVLIGVSALVHAEEYIQYDIGLHNVLQMSLTRHGFSVNSVSPLAGKRVAY